MYILGGFLSDMWSYNIATGIWTFEGGNKEIDQGSHPGVFGVYGPLNNPGGLREPCMWKDTTTNELWLFGGQTYGFGTLSTKALHDAIF